MNQLELFPTDVHLRCIDPASNKRRFYALSVQRTLLGEWALVREWGGSVSAVDGAERPLSVRRARRRRVARTHAAEAPAGLRDSLEPKVFCDELVRTMCQNLSLTVHKGS